MEFVQIIGRKRRNAQSTEPKNKLVGQRKHKERTEQTSLGRVKIKKKSCMAG
jgi:hypothetical protein